MQQTNCPTPLLDIERALLADTSGTLRRQYVERLEQMADTARQRMRSMCDRTTYTHTNAALDAINGALDALRTINRAKPESGAELKSSPFSIASYIK